MPSLNRSALFVGFALITVGVLFLLNNVGLLPPAVARFWPVLIVAAGIWLLGSALRRRSGGLMGGVVVLTTGVLLLLRNFDYMPDSAFGPAMLVAVGVGLLLRGLVRAS